LKKIGFNDDCCITSIRHSEEVEELRKRKDFVLVNVAAPRSVRFERMQKRKRLGDPQTLKKFTEFEEKESQTEGSGQQLGKTADMADITFVNDSNDVSNLGTAVEKLLKDIKNV
jgi:dephospho-CoA kinase